MAIALLLTSVTRVSYPHLELYGLNIKREKEQIYSNETKEQACLDETEGLELVRLLQVHQTNPSGG